MRYGKTFFPRQGDVYGGDGDGVGGCEVLVEEVDGFVPKMSHSEVCFFFLKTLPQVGREGIQYELMKGERGLRGPPGMTVRGPPGWIILLLLSLLDHPDQSSSSRPTRSTWHFLA